MALVKPNFKKLNLSDQVISRFQDNVESWINELSESSNNTYFCKVSDNSGQTFTGNGSYYQITWNNKEDDLQDMFDGTDTIQVPENQGGLYLVGARVRTEAKTTTGANSTSSLRVYVNGSSSNELDFDEHNSNNAGVIFSASGVTLIRLESLDKITVNWAINVVNANKTMTLDNSFVTNYFFVWKVG